MSTVTLIAAVADIRVVGDRGGVARRLPGELVHFKETTMGCLLVMGRVTFESIVRPLPGRRTIVLTRDPGWSRPGVETAPTFEDAVALARSMRSSSPGTGLRACAADGGSDDPHARPAPAGGDGFFPAFGASGWQVTGRVAYPAYEVVTYERPLARTSTAVPDRRSRIPS